MAEQKLLHVTVTKVDGPLFDGEAVSVHVPGAAGEMEILARHEALISPLKNGKVTVKLANGEVEQFVIESGTLEVSNNRATILV